MSDGGNTSGWSTSEPPRPRLEVGAALRYGWQKFQQHPGQLVVIVFLIAIANLVFALAGNAADRVLTQVVLQLVGFVVGQLLALGVIRASLDITAGRVPEVARVFRTERLGAYILATLMYIVVVAVGIVLCVLPGLAAMIFLAFYGFYVLDRGFPPAAALGASFRLVRANFGAVLGLLVVAVLLYIVGALLFGVGLLLTAPIAWIMIAYGYRVLNEEPVAP